MLKKEMEEKIEDLEGRLSENRRLCGIAERDKAAVLERLVDLRESEAKVEHAKWALTEIWAALRSAKADFNHTLENPGNYTDEEVRQEREKLVILDDQSRNNAASIAYAAIERLKS